MSQLSTVWSALAIAWGVAFVLVGEREARTELAGGWRRGLPLDVRCAHADGRLVQVARGMPTERARGRPNLYRPDRLRLPVTDRSDIVSPSSVRAGWVGVGAVVVALLVVRVVAPDGLAGHTAYLVTTLGAAAAAWLGGQRWSGRARLAWRFAAFGLALSGLGDVAARVYEVYFGGLPGASLADVGWLGSYFAIGVGLYFLAKAEGRASRDVEVAIDVAMVAVVALLVMWYLSAAPTMADTETPLRVRLVWASYPIADAALLALAVRLLLVRGRGVAGPLMAAGVGCWLAADVAYALTAATGSYSVLLDVGWMVGPAVIAAAAWTSPSRTPTGDATTQPLGSVRVTLSMLPLLAPGIIQVAIGGTGGALPAGGLLAVTVVLLGLMAARALRFVHTTHALRARVESKERYFRALADNSSDATVVVGSSGSLLDRSPQLEILVGPNKAVAAGDEVTELVHPDDRPAFTAQLERAVGSPGTVVSAEVRLAEAGSHQRWVSIRAVDLTADADVGGVVVNLHDVTQRKHAEQELEHQALHDELTGLANRAVLRDRLEHVLQRSQRGAQSSAVIYLDLDGFKKVNDTLGHDAGDELLTSVAHTLTQVVRTADTVARLGGDEFAILIEDASRPGDEAVAIAERILVALSSPILAGGRNVVVSASLGITVIEPDATVTSVLRDADVAMYRAKATGRHRWVMYEPEMHALEADRLQLELDMMGALDGDQFDLDYQPVVELESGRIVGFEALLRWQHPTRGLVGPDQFISIAEDTGAIIPIGRWVLKTACATLAEWCEAHPDTDHLTMHVNVSGRQLTGEGLVDDVARTVEAAGITPSCLVLELTESVLLDDINEAAPTLDALHKLGVRLAIDDFGTGYSSLSYLRQFPFDILKVDRSFIATITDQEHAPGIVRGLLDLAATLGLDTVAEGIELDVQHQRLRDGHCEFGQGFLFARPMTSEQAHSLLEASATAKPTTVSSATPRP